MPTLGVLLLLALGAVRGAETTQSPPRPAVSGIRAQLFQNKSGQLSENILDSKYRGGWNTIAGPKAANATLIVVEVSGIPAESGAGQKYSVKLVARETGRTPKVLLTSTQRVPASNDRGTVYLPFLIHQTGCSPVTVSALLIGPQPGKPVERTLAFACGE